ncbi:hypothetical protein [Streptomyces sp. YS415]|uniref:hypothetical protein n=1 Tax=Streptomyces sp. YS415 TaxID=2944806 RepID=UPI00201FDE2E|nr:hypothetical protein [Streptomyces sp. YS415]MCL7428059.1 hypothetical protein [Streptomyces sp. YS415]
MDIDTVADELYALRPEDFTAARNVRAAEARTAGERALAEQIGKLRRPSRSAWVSNLLVRERPDEVAALLKLGEGLRRAHHDLDGAQLRELSGRQRTLIRALSQEARQLAARAGHPVGDDVGREVEATLHTVLADPEAAREWAQGRLARPFEAAVGFPDASPAAVRRPAAPPPAPPPAKRRDDEALARARRDADTAASELRALEEEAAGAGREAEAARESTARLERRFSELTDELNRVEEDLRRARDEERRARDGLRALERRVREAGRRAETATARLERHQKR